MKLSILVNAAFILVIGLLPVAARAADPVPSEFSSLYLFLGNQLSQFNAALDTSTPVQQPKAPTFSAELVTANSQNGEKLLTPEMWTGNLVALDRLQQMGLQGVRVTINYPVLSAWFPRNGEYLDFYRQLSGEIRRRGMKLHVQTHLTFTDPEFSPANCGTGYEPIQVDYSGMTLGSMKLMKRAYAQKIINEIHPDYLTVADEPSTLVKISGVTELANPAKYRELVQYVLFGLDRQGVLIGAGAGTWEQPGMFSELITKTSLDYIDVHIYPVNYDFLTRAIGIADAARLYGKRLVIGETGLYKAANSEVGDNAATSPSIFSRDVFSFWAPLDSAHIGLITKLATLKGYDLISPFYINYFFNYLPYDSETSQLTPMERFCASYDASAKGISDGSITEYGQYYQDLISTYGNN